MLKEVFRTETLKYFKPGHETLQGWGVYGMVCSVPSPDTVGSTSIILHGVVGTDTYQGADFRGWRFSCENGKLIQAWDLLSSGGGFGGSGSDTPGALPPPAGFLSMTYTTTSRGGKYWGSGWSNGYIQQYHYGNLVTILPGDDEIKKKDPWWILDGAPLNYTFWKPVGGGPYLPGKCFAIDDLAVGGGRFLSTDNTGLAVFNWKSGKQMYSLAMAGAIVDLSLADEDRIYVLLENRTVVLVDYMRGEMLGAAKIPPLDTGDPYGGDSGLDVIFDGVRMAWDRPRSRLLICENTPDKPDHSSTVCVRGFRLVPEPVRLTVPIPLKAPRRGRTIPVLIQVVDDMNQGVGGYVVVVKVTGAGSLAGIPISDTRGNTFIQVACDGGTEYGSAI